jgi:hypothetical protein
MNGRATLPNQNRARSHLLTAEALDSKALTGTITTVS